MDVLLGHVPELMELVCMSVSVEKYLVVTKAQTQRKHTDEERKKELNETSKSDSLFFSLMITCFRR